MQTLIEFAIRNLNEMRETVIAIRRGPQRFELFVKEWRAAMATLTEELAKVKAQSNATVQAVHEHFSTQDQKITDLTAQVQKLVDEHSADLPPDAVDQLESINDALVALQNDANAVKNNLPVGDNAGTATVGGGSSGTAVVDDGTAPAGADPAKEVEGDASGEAAT